MSAAIYNHRAESMDPDERRQLQLERLQETLYRACRNVAFYRSAFKDRGIDIESFTDLASMRRLPFTTQEDLRKSYPYGMFAVPLKEIVRIHSSGGGTIEQPLVIGHTRNDLRHWVECSSRVLTAAGVNEHDVIQFSLDCQHSSAASGFQQGAEQIGASVIRASGCSSTLRQVAVLRDFKTSVLVCSPHHAAALANTMKALNVSTQQTHLKRIIVMGVRWTQKMREEIESQLGIETFHAYGPEEIMSPGVAGECEGRCGLHINEDHVIAEVVDPYTTEPLADGLRGELVLTTITKEGFPLIRYRTGDLTSLDRATCGCGRTTMRMSGLAGRTDNLVVFRNASFYPSQVARVLESVCGVRPRYRIVLDRKANMETLELRLEIGEGMPPLDEIRALESLRNDVATQMKMQLDVDVKVSLAEPRSLAAAGMGVVLDNRP